MSLYKRLSQMRTAESMTALREEIEDRYGAPPREVRELLEYAALRLRAEALGVQQVDLAARGLELRFGSAPALAPQALVELVKALPGAALRPTGLRAPLGEGEDALSGLTRVLGRLELLARSPAL
jgi:transcription-repair coupling factor (superfamily II helicase)